MARIGSVFMNRPIMVSIPSTSADCPETTDPNTTSESLQRWVKSRAHNP